MQDRREGDDRCRNRAVGQEQVAEQHRQHREHHEPLDDRRRLQRHLDATGPQGVAGEGRDDASANDRDQDQYDIKRCQHRRATDQRVAGAHPVKECGVGGPEQGE